MCPCLWDVDHDAEHIVIVILMSLSLDPDRDLHPIDRIGCVLGLWLMHHGPCVLVRVNIFLFVCLCPWFVSCLLYRTSGDVYNFVKNQYMLYHNYYHKPPILNPITCSVLIAP